MRNTAEMPLTLVIFILSSSGDEVELILLLLASFFITLIFNQIAGNCKHCAILGACQISLWLKTKAYVWVNIEKGGTYQIISTVLRVSATTKSRTSTASNEMNSDICDVGLSV